MLQTQSKEKENRMIDIQVKFQAIFTSTVKIPH